MPWTEEKALRRIREMRRTAPVGDISVEDFEPYVRRREVLAKDARLRGSGGAEPIWEVPRNRAVTTHGVHVYANLIDYNEHALENGRETEASCERALQLLHLHFGGCDQLIEAFECQRVDFHGSRLHAVVMTPVGPDRELERIEKAIAFAAAFREMVARASGRFGAGYRTRVRIGIDSGPAVAVNSGRGGEHEPLFIGSPANYAAKLADGDVDGIFLSPHVREIRRGSAGGWNGVELTKAAEGEYLNRTFASAAGGFRAAARLDLAFDALVSERENLAKTNHPEPASFLFHQHRPPLRTIEFQNHPPSNAIRMPLAAVFADIDGFTRYIDQAIEEGQVAQAVANLHVLRGELAAVLREDFGGRKVRFIGDCLHGVVAEGAPQLIDDQQTVRSAVLAAAAMRSSFELCKRELPGVEALGIAIGIEFGVTPVCRLGLRGEASVRCSVSRATCGSEEEQRRCNGWETAIGEVAFAAGGVLIQHLFRGNRKAVGLTYTAACALLTGPASLERPRSAPIVRRPEPEPMRAHCR
jgi:class 3 adenylate cyclase